MTAVRHLAWVLGERGWLMSFGGAFGPLLTFEPGAASGDSEPKLQDAAQCANGSSSY
ncbi:hypothetical protein HOE425_330520 [Hoeflea sp. EC-HK425]|nr:hypothetical protein HOE425_330520 [Hoeflea sp. EC-HK425]